MPFFWIQLSGRRKIRSSKSVHMILLVSSQSVNLVWVWNFATGERWNPDTALIESAGLMSFMVEFEDGCIFKQQDHILNCLTPQKLTETPNNSSSNEFPIPICWDLAVTIKQSTSSGSEWACWIRMEQSGIGPRNQSLITFTECTSRQINLLNENTFWIKGEESVWFMWSSMGLLRWFCDYMHVLQTSVSDFWAAPLKWCGACIYWPEYH